MNRPLPILATLLGAAGLIPFAACGVAALGQEGDRAAMALVSYGAVILAFLGGVHWGFALTDATTRGERNRLALGVVPSLAGWLGLLLAIAVRVEAGMGLLLVAFVATTMVEARAERAGLMPRGYMILRYCLSAGVILVLALVLLLRVIGAHVMLW